MNAETFIIECGVLAVDICFSYLVYNLYKSSAKCLKSLQEAQCFEIDSSLQQKIKSSNGVVEYAVISGNIRSLILPISPAGLAPPLVNKGILNFYRYIQRIFYEKYAKELKAKWNPLLRSWSSTIYDLISDQYQFVIAPFALCSKSRGLFKKQVLVEVLEPQSGLNLEPQSSLKELLSDVPKEFILDKDAIDVAVLGFFHKELFTCELPEFKGMLFEDQVLTAVGKLVLENNKMKIKPPDNGLTYFVTHLDVESLINKISTKTKFYKIASIMMGTLTLILLVCVTRRAFSEIKRRTCHSQELKRLEELRQRRMADTSKMVMYAQVLLVWGILSALN